MVHGATNLSSEGVLCTPPNIHNNNNALATLLKGLTKKLLTLLQKKTANTLYVQWTRGIFGSYADFCFHI